MKQAKLERVLMPNTYVKHVAQEFSDHERLTTGSGIPADALLTYAEPVSVAQHLQIIRNALELSGRSDWYFAWGRRMAEHFHGPITLAWLSAPTLGAGLDTFLKFIPSRVPYHRWSGQVEGAEFVCEVRELIDLGPVRVTLVEIPLLVMHEYVRTIRPGPMQGARIELRYPPPEHAAVYGEWYGCEVRFNAPRNALVIPAAWRAVHNMGHDEGTWTTSLRHCEVLCAITEDKDTLTSVRRMLFNRFERPLGERVIPSLEEVAAALHLSPRTLIRRLRSVDTTYQAVVDGVQQQRARELLGNPNLRIQDVAVELGYQDPNSFARSFKRWFAMTPGDYRRRVNGDDA
ncbi:MAG: AraC family transcriptional regulator [Proteobacteria bacterium]|nr:AraC family transcriptional regulator [Pseudomonadota bacterium]